MKKSLSCLLACMLILCLLLPCAALAESNKDRPLKNDRSSAAPAESTENTESTEIAETAASVETVRWTGDDGLFSIAVPADWTEYDADMMLQLLQEQVDAGLLDETGMNEAMQQSMMELEGLYAMFYGPDWIANMNISVEDSGGVDLVKYAAIMIPSIKAQYENMGVTLDVAEARTIGAHECIVTEMDYLGSWITQAMLTSPDKSKTITLTFTDFTPEIRDAVVGSLVFAE